MVLLLHRFWRCLVSVSRYEHTQPRLAAAQQYVESVSSLADVFAMLATHDQGDRSPQEAAPPVDGCSASYRTSTSPSATKRRKSSIAPAMPSASGRCSTSISASSPAPSISLGKARGASS